MKLAILGATGGTGRAAVEHALARGHDVVAIARRPDAVTVRHDRLRVVPGNVADATTLVEPLRAVDAAINCVGVSGLLEARRGTTLYSQGTRHLLDAAGKAGLGRLLAVSSGGVTPQPHDGWFYRRILKPFFLEKMYADMRLMEAAIQASALDWTIVRAPYLTNGPARTDWKTRAGAPLDEDGALTRGSLAAFLVGEAETPQFSRQIVYVSY